MIESARFRRSHRGSVSRRCLKGAGVLAAACALAGPAGAVIVAGDPGQNAPSNTTAPAGFEDAWDRVGSIGGGSGVYLGNGYVLSARHVGGGNTFTVDGTTHFRIAGTTVTLTNPAALGLSAEADLWINRYAIRDTSPLFGMGVLDIRSTTLETAGSGGVLIGEGVGQTTTTPINVGSTHSGYVWDNNEEKRWGDIGITGASDTITANGRDVVGAASFSFQEIEGRGNAAAGDSGGGLFYLNDGVVELAGITHVVTLLNGQNDDTTAFGNRTLFSNLSVYFDQINIVEGDLTGDGFVGVQDLDLILANWGTTVTRGDWTQGDATGDGQVGQDDLDLVQAHFGEGSAPSSVPEPATLTLLLGLGACLTRRRRKAQKT